MAEKMTAGFIIDVLRRRYKLPVYALLTEVWTHGGPWSAYGVHQNISPRDAIRSIDAVAVLLDACCFEVIAFEVKTTRANWLTELRDPDKRVRAYFQSNESWFVVAPGVVDLTRDRIAPPDEDWGIIEVGPDGSQTTLKRASRRDMIPLHPLFIQTLLRRAVQTPPEICGFQPRGK